MTPIASDLVVVCVCYYTLEAVGGARPREAVGRGRKVKKARKRRDSALRK